MRVIDTRRCTRSIKVESILKAQPKKEEKG